MRRVLRRIWMAIRIFFAALFYAEVAAEVERILKPAAAEGQTSRQKPPVGRASRPTPSAETADLRPPAKKSPQQSEAITLLAALQREARFIDFIQEPLGSFSDAQIGAAARDVHRDCGRVLERLFTLRPIVEREEGSEMEVPARVLEEEAGRYRLTGNVTGEPPFRGRLRHHGWEATTCELPTWSGTQAAARTVAPVEVEL